MEKQNLQKDSSGIQTVGSVLKVIGSWIYRLRKVLMATRNFGGHLSGPVQHGDCCTGGALTCRPAACTPR